MMALYLILIGLAYFSCPVVTHAQESTKTWSRVVNHEHIPREGELRVLELGVVRQEENQLIGELEIHQSAGLADQARTLTIDGSQGSDGAFWPTVQLQVSDGPGTEWKTVVTPANVVVPAQLVLYPGLAIFGMRVKLDALQPLIGKHRLGRIVLKTGEAAEFSLDLLAPPPSVR
jgi:hypothetical protein